VVFWVVVFVLILPLMILWVMIGFVLVFGLWEYLDLKKKGGVPWLSSGCFTFAYICKKKNVVTDSGFILYSFVHFFVTLIF